MEEKFKQIESDDKIVITQKDIEKAEKNPYKAKLLYSFLKFFGVLVGYYTINKFAPGEFANIANSLSILVGGALSVDMTASLINFFGYKKFKKTHKGKNFDSHYFEQQRIQDNRSLYGGHKR